MNKIIIFLICLSLSSFLFVGCKSKNHADKIVSVKMHPAPIEDINNGVAPVPEPATILLLGSGLAGLGWLGRKKKK